MKFNRYIRLFIVLLLVSHSIFAQTPSKAPTQPVAPAKPISPPNPLQLKPSKPLKEHPIKLEERKLLLKKLDIELKDLNVKLKKDLMLDLNHNLKDITNLKILPDFNYDFNFTDADNKSTSQGQNFNTVEKVKRVTKSYRVNNKNKLSIDNQYGKVVINVWSKNEIKVDIEIKAYEGSEAEAQKLLDAVSIVESDNGKLIDYTTKINQSTGGWGMKRSSDGKEKRRGVSIDYVVYMPSDNPLEITNKFGSIVLTEYDGPLTIKNSYGSFAAKELRNAANVIDVRYGSATIEKLKEGKINVSYGSLVVSNANQINSDVRYGTTRIGKLSNGGKLENKYGNLRIEELASTDELLLITTDKGSVTMGVNPTANFDFDVTVNMGGFQYSKDKVNITSKTPEEGRPQLTKNYKGEFGKGSDSQVQIKCSYGSVKFQ